MKNKINKRTEIKKVTASNHWSGKSKNNFVAGSFGLDIGYDEISFGSILYLWAGLIYIIISLNLVKYFI